jgi:hypothetical protein
MLKILDKNLLLGQIKAGNTITIWQRDNFLDWGGGRLNGIVVETRFLPPKIKQADIFKYFEGLIKGDTSCEKYLRG